MRDPNRNPYVGARPFEREDKPYFFGRDEEARQLTSLVIAHRVALFYAPSGAGKTSLLTAKVIPDLEERRRVRVLPIGRVGGDFPRDVGRDQIANIYIFNALISLAGENARPGELADARLVDGLGSYLLQEPDEERLHPRLLILDQFEEMFTTHPDRMSDRADFFLQLRESLEMHSHLSLLITMREDYIANLDFYAAQLPDRLRTRFRMELLGRTSALAAVKEPAQNADCPFADGVAETLVDNLRRLQTGRSQEGMPAASSVLGDYIEPVHLQIVCRQLWIKLPAEREVIELSDVQAFGDVDEALKSFYEDALKKVFKKVPVGQRRLRLWFDRSLITSARTRNLVYRGESETAGLPNAVVEVLYDEYIIRPVTRGYDVWYELAHDRLVEPILDANRRWRQERPDMQQHAASVMQVSIQATPDAGPSPGPLEAAEGPSALPGFATTGNPYVGLRPFQRGEHLYGRERETNSLLDLLINERVVLMYSPTGAGKTSFINAAVIPELEQEGFRILGPVRVGLEMSPESITEQSDAGVINPYIFSLLLSLEMRRVSEEHIAVDALAHMSLADYLSRYPARPAGCQGDVWIFEQFEELFTINPVDILGKYVFFQQIGEVLSEASQWALFAMREELIANLDSYVQFIPGRLSTRFRLEPLSAEAALGYVTRTAAEAGVRFAPAAVVLLVDELRAVRIRRPDGSTVVTPGPYLSPHLLQAVCCRLWETLPPGQLVIGEEDVRALGDVDATFGQFYDEAVKRASHSTGASERSIRNWIDGQLITEAGGRARVLSGHEETEGLDNRTVHELAAARLLRAEAIGPSVWYELMHDRLVRPVLESNRAWFAQNTDALTQAAVAWRDAGRDPARLYTGPLLAAAKDQLRTHPGESGALEREFIEASRLAEYRAAALRQRMIASIAVALSVVFIGLAFMAMLSWAEMRSARQKAEAEAQRAATAELQAINARDDVNKLQATLAMQVAVLLTIQATPTPSIGTEPVATPSPPLSLTPTADQMATVEAIQTQLLMIQTTQTAIASGVPTPMLPITPTHTVLPSATPNPTVPAQIRVTPTPLTIGPPRGRIMFVSNRNSPQDLYVMAPDGSALEQWSFSRGQEPSFTPGQPLLAFTKLRVASKPESIYVRPLGGGEERLVTKPADWDYWEPSIAPDGTRIAASSSHGNVVSEIFIVDLNGSIVRQLTQWNPRKSESPAWSPDGQYIAFVSDHEGNKEIYLAKADGSDAPINLTKNGAADTDPAWSPNSRSIAFISDRDAGNRDLWVINLAEGDQSPLNLTHSSEEERYPGWSLDGNWVAFTRSPPGQDRYQDVYLMRVDGTMVKNLTQSPQTEDFQPVWVP